MMKRLMGILIVLTLFVLGGQAFATSNAKGDSWLFVLSARQADVINQKGVGQLILHDVSRTVLAFTDRPNRKVGQVTVARFIQKWPKAFSKDQPNGAFVHANLGVKSDGTVEPVAVELKNPRIKGHDVIFTIKVLGGQSVKAQSLHDVSVFIDDDPGFSLP